MGSIPERSKDVSENAQKKEEMCSLGFMPA